MGTKRETISLVDDQGNEHEFNVVDVIEVASRRYAVLQPTEGGDEAVIFRVEDDETLSALEDEEEFNRVAAALEDLEEEEDIVDLEDEDDENLEDEEDLEDEDLEDDLDDLEDDDEEAFDRMAAQMTVRGRLAQVRCPTLLVTGEFDPLCPLEEAIEAFDELRVPKELWVFENQFHQLWKLPNLGSLDCHEYVLDWLARVLARGLPAEHRRIAYVRVGGDGPWGACEWTPPVGPGQAYF